MPEDSEVDTEVKSFASITYNGTKPTIKVGGSYKTFTPAFSNESVTVSKWFISDENGDVSTDVENYTIKYDGDKLKIKIAPNYNLIGKILLIQLVGSDDSTAEISVEVV